MFVVRKIKEPDWFWVAVAGSNDGKDVDHVWGRKGTEFHEEFDATLVARVATRDGFPAEVVPAPV